MPLTCSFCNESLSGSTIACPGCGNGVAELDRPPHQPEEGVPAALAEPVQTDPPAAESGEVTPKPTAWWESCIGWGGAAFGLAVVKFAGMDLLLHGLGIALGYGMGHMLLRGSRRVLLLPFGLLVSQALIVGVGLALTMGFQNLDWYHLDVAVPILLAILLVVFPNWLLVGLSIAMEVFYLAVHIAALSRVPVVLEALPFDPAGHEAGLAVWILSRLAAIVAILVGVLDWRKAQQGPPTG